MKRSVPPYCSGMKVNEGLYVQNIEKIYENI